MPKPLIYIAGPLTTGDCLHNLHFACHLWRDFYNAGLLAILPHWSALQDMVAPLHYDDWMRYCLAIVARCQAVFRMDGESKGADIEVKEARKLGIPVFRSVTDLIQWSTNYVRG